MSDALVRTFEGHDVRVLTRDGDPWFVAADVCAALTIANARDAVAKLDDDEKDGVGLADAIGRTQQTTLISEPGLYRLIMRSDKPEAVRFQKWVTKEVLPAIRKTGAYSIAQSNPALLRENRLAAKEERLGREQKLRVFRELKEILSLTAEERRVICVKEAEIVGEPMPALLPKNEHADWITPTDIAVRVSSTANAVGRVITALKLKGDDGKGIEGLSEPKHNIAPGTNRSITTYVYSPTAVEQIVAHFASHRPS